MIEKKYSIAKDLWMEIVIQQPKNANTNYKTGLCLLESSNSKLESLKYLKTVYIYAMYRTLQCASQGNHHYKLNICRIFH